MKIQQKQNYNTPSFQAGLHSSFLNEIKYCRPYKIEHSLNKIGIQADFKNNQYLAWATIRCINMILKMNEHFNLDLNIPLGIFVEDFDKLNIEDDNRNAFGLCNFFNTKRHKNSNKITKGMSIIYNKNIDWENIDKIADSQYGKGQAPTNFFLDTVIHEFMHIFHEGNLIKNFTPEQIYNFLLKSTDEKIIYKADSKYLNEIKNICNYAFTNPIECLACNLTKKIINSINKFNLSINKNPFSNKIESNFDKYMSDLWEGKLIV